MVERQAQASLGKTGKKTMSKLGSIKRGAPRFQQALSQPVHPVLASTVQLYSTTLRLQNWAAAAGVAC